MVSCSRFGNVQLIRIGGLWSSILAGKLHVVMLSVIWQTLLSVWLPGGKHRIAGWSMATEAVDRWVSCEVVTTSCRIIYETINNDLWVSGNEIKHDTYYLATKSLGLGIMRANKYWVVEMNIEFWVTYELINMGCLGMTCDLKRVGCGITVRYKFITECL